MDDKPEWIKTWSEQCWDFRQLPDNTWCCLGRFLFTVAIMIDVKEQDYSHRYCYGSLREAEDAYRDFLEDPTQEPKNYVKRKGQ